MQLSKPGNPEANLTGSLFKLQMAMPAFCVKNKVDSDIFHGDSNSNG